jgi:hypothetical protein
MLRFESQAREDKTNVEASTQVKPTVHAYHSGNTDVSGHPETFLKSLVSERE